MDLSSRDAKFYFFNLSKGENGMTAFLSKIMAGCVLFTALLSGTAHADFVNIDWKEAGDNRAVVDTETGIEWLKLAETYNESSVGALAKTGEGQKYEGWRLATESEVFDMMLKLLDVTEAELESASQGIVTNNVFQVRRDDYLDDFTLWENAFGSYAVTDASQFIKEAYLGYGMYLSDDGEEVLSGRLYHVIDDSGGNSDDDNVYRQRSIVAHKHEGQIPSPIVGIFLVNDGGVTLSSIQDPSINVNNPNAPTSVSVGGGVSALVLMLGAARLRRRRV